MARSTMDPKKNRVSLGHLTTAGKWMMVAVTTSAAVLGLLVSARNLGLTPWLKTNGISFADLAARRVLVTPAVDTLRALGDTLHLAATITDDHGATLSGTNILWTTDDSMVATVDSAGDVVARAAGSTTIGAAVREHRATARVTVWQKVRAVLIAHDSLLHLTEGNSLELVSRALDARGRVVQGRGIKWASADSGIVAVSSTGGAQAVGAGRTTLTASIDGYSSTVAAEVVFKAAAVQVLAGSAQRAPAGRPLPRSVQLQVSSRSGRPVPDAQVTFATDAAEGTVESATAATDRNGRTRASWTLGPHAGRQRLLITIAGMDSTLQIVAEADPLPRNTRIQLAGQAPAGAAGTKLAEAVGIRVTDSAGAADADVPVVWSALDGGRLEAQASRTDSVGEAWAHWVLGPRAGAQHARVQVGNPRTMPAFRITAAVVADTAATLALLSGGGQAGRVGAALERPIVFRLNDRYGNPAGGGSVAVTALAGSVADSAPLSDAEGKVRIHWTLGRMTGAQALQVALSSGASAPIRITARALAVGPANVALESPPHSGSAGRALAKPITATVTDVYGNPVADALVVFSTSAGSLTPARAMTDAQGHAATHWTMGPAAGDQTIAATVRGTSVTTSAVVRATKNGKQ